MNKIGKTKDKIDVELLICPYTDLKNTCVSDKCMAWESTADNHGYCKLIDNK